MSNESNTLMYNSTRSAGEDELLTLTDADLLQWADDPIFRRVVAEMARPAKPMYFDISECDDDHEPVPIPTDLWEVNTGDVWHLVEPDEFGWPVIRLAMVIAATVMQRHTQDQEAIAAEVEQRIKSRVRRLVNMMGADS